MIAVRTGRSPSQLLMPLVFGAHAGSMLTLTGTPVNVIVSQYAADLTGVGFGFFEFAFAGVPLLAGAACVAVGAWALFLFGSAGTALAAGLLIMFVLYTGWGLWEITSLPSGALP